MTSKVFEDPLDSEEFDCVQYINNTFPTEGSLDTLDTFIVSIGAQISTLDEEISKAVQTQSVIGKEASKDIVETQQSIEDLFTKINDIKLKASQSEKMVQEICADIKKLDYAKNHLQTSITSLNRLQMLINAVGQLEILAHEQAYRDAANLLDAVKQFMTHFDQYQHISVIQDIVRRVEVIRSSLLSHIQDIFRQLARAVDSVADAELVLDLPGGAGVGAGGGMKILGDSCLCVDALGPAARKELLEEFVQLQLVPYDALFSFGKQHCQLDQVDRRWSWFKRLLKHIDVKYSIFPTHWRLPLRLCMDFTERTKVHLVALLTEMESTDSTDVHILLKALQSTLRFEQEMTDRFNLLQELSKESEEVRADEQLKRDDKLMYIPTDHTAANKEDETGSGFIALAHSTISGVSGVFDKFLGSYVLLERQNLEDMLHRLSMEEDTTAEGAGLAGTSSNGNVYGSSTSMFVFIKNSIKRCTALTTGQSFLALSGEFKTCMVQYVELLRRRLPAAGARLGTSVGEVTMCYLINTGEYCAEVVPQLELMVRQKMVPHLSERVVFDAQVDAFMDFVAHCIKVLVSGVMDRLEPSFRTMGGLNWGSSAQVGDESPYLHTFNAVLLDCMPKIRDALSSTYFNNVCTKIASEATQRYLAVITKQKHISDVATQQLLLDTYNMKAVLLQMPHLAAPSSAPITTPKPAMYIKLVTNKIAHIEMVLKLVGTPEEMLLERFKIMWPDGKPADLQMLMGLKGTKRSDQQVLLEMLGIKTPDYIKDSGGGGEEGGNWDAANSYSAASAAASSAAALASSSMKSLTMETRNALGNLKWSKNM